MRKTLLLAATVFLVNGLAAFAQSSEVVDGLLAEKSATAGKCVYMVLAAVGIVTEDASAAQALDALKAKGWKTPAWKETDSMNLGDFSYLIMKAFDIGGGLMYTIIPSGRYAARELNYLGILSSNPDPGRVLSGEEAMDILFNALEWKEANK